MVVRSPQEGTVTFAAILCLAQRQVKETVSAGSVV
jgi:hypothetical protein